MSLTGIKTDHFSLRSSKEAQDKISQALEANGIIGGLGAGGLGMVRDSSEDNSPFKSVSRAVSAQSSKETPAFPFNAPSHQVSDVEGGSAVSAGVFSARPGSQSANPNTIGKALAS